ncbi:Serine/threonine-protein phosphatase 1 [compost metagenome]
MVGMRRRTYAIGDLHGRLDLLLAALDAIENDAGDDGADIVCLGDYVDKGPNSRAVLEVLMNGPRRLRDSLTCLRGNHEAMLLRACHSPDSRRWWVSQGGDATLSSFGGEVPSLFVAWLAALPAIHVGAGRVFVHAGLMPGVPLQHQDEDTMMWIRDRFLHAIDPQPFAMHVVHGHTPEHAGKPNAADPELLSWRTNLDTAAYRTGVLAVGVFEGVGGPADRILAIMP